MDLEPRLYIRVVKKKERLNLEPKTILFADLIAVGCRAVCSEGVFLLGGDDFDAGLFEKETLWAGEYLGEE